MQRTLALLFFVASFLAEAQIKSRIYVDGVLVGDRSFSDTVALTTYVNKKQIEWVGKGFYFTGIDSLMYREGTSKVYLHRGEKYRANTENITGRNWTKQTKAALERYSNHGYPFVSIRLDSTILSNGKLEGIERVDKGPQIVYDSASFLTPLKTKKNYLYAFLDIEPGKPFSEKDYRLIAKKIERSPLFELSQPVDISFRKNMAKVYLGMKELQASSFQGVLGLQQGADGKSQVVGSLDLDIRNLFKSGKQLMLFWERFSGESQHLDLYYKHPLIFGSKISPSFRFDLLKQDTTFITRTSELGVNTAISAGTNLFFGYEATNGSLLTSNELALANRGLADYKRNIYRLTISNGEPDALNGLKKDFIWSATVGGGTKTVERNLNIDISYYDSIELQTNFYRLDMRAAYQLLIGDKQTIFHHVEAGALRNDQILTNELYRLGGLHSIRGFNEKALFANEYMLSRLELRSFFENRSFVYLFYDQLLQRRIANNDQPFGIGIGFTLATLSGQFSFALASGHSKNQNLGFSDLRAHFGFLSRF